MQKLIPMTAANKKSARKKIGSMKTCGITNLWGGIREGLGLFDSVPAVGNVPAVMVLTDGIPNHM